MEWNSSRSFVAAFCAVTVLISLAAVAVTSLVLSNRQRDAIVRERIRAGGALLEHLAAGSALPLLSDDAPMLNSLIKQSRDSDSILYAAVTDRRGIIRAHSDPSRIGSRLSPPEGEAVTPDREGAIAEARYRLPDGRSVLELALAIRFGDTPVGSIRIGLPLDRLREGAQRESGSSLPILVLLGMGVGLVAAGLSYAVGSRFFQRVAREGREDLHAGSAPAFGVKEGEPSRRQVTVLYAGVKDFRGYANSRESDEVMRCLRQYFSVASEIIQGYGGTVYKQFGDVLVGVFGSPDFQGDHTKRAVRAAVSMIKTFRENGLEENDLLRRASIGISTGVVLSSRLGEGERTEQFHVGEIFEAAGFLQEAANPGDIVIGKEVYQTVESLVSVEPLPPSDAVGARSAWEAFRLLRIEERRNRA